MYVHHASALAQGGAALTQHHVQRFRLDIPQATGEIVPEARHWLRDIGAKLGLDTEDAELLLTELLANVAEHADGGPAWITVAIGASLVVGVGDHRPDKPLHRHPYKDPLTLGGRGLDIAYALAARLWVDKRRPGTKRVTVRLPIGGN